MSGLAAELVVGQLKNQVLVDDTYFQVDKNKGLQPITAVFAAASISASVVLTAADIATYNGKVVLLDKGVAFTVDLPAASVCSGVKFTFKCIGVGTATIDANADLIDGIATLDLFTYDAATLVCNGTTWYII